jgi:hypothetical protein
MGTSVAMQGDTYYYGLPGWSGYSGKLVISKYYEKEKNRYDEDVDARRHFGEAVAVHNGHYIIGAPGSTQGVSDEGTVFFGTAD